MMQENIPRISQEEISKKNELRLIYQKGSKRKKYTTIVYKIFAKCAELIVDDQEWKDLFENISMARFPKYISISDGNIFSTSKKHEFTFPLVKLENACDKDLLPLIEELKENIKKSSSVFTQKDKKRHMKSILCKSDETQNTWYSMTKGVRKDVLLMKYSSSLNEKIKKYTPRIIFCFLKGFLSEKLLNTSKIDMNNGEIEMINDLDTTPPIAPNALDHSTCKESSKEGKLWSNYVKNKVKLI
jgi:hypothetical protein